MIDILKDDKLNSVLHEKGYVIIPFLSEADVLELRTKFHELHPQRPTGFYATTHVPDTNFRKRASSLIKQILDIPIGAKLKNINALGGAFLSKPPGETGILHLHQDWNIVNEECFESYNIWIPLTDVNEQNGAVKVLEGSHNKMVTFRGPNLKSILSKVGAETEQVMKSMNMKAGEALIYNHALWHSSPANRSDQDRLAVVYGIIPAQAQMKYYYRNGNLVEEYDSNLDFFFENNPQDGPQQLTLSKTIVYDFPELSTEQFRKNFVHGRNKNSGMNIRRFLDFFSLFKKHKSQ